MPALTPLTSRHQVQILPSRLQVRVLDGGVPHFTILTRGRVSAPPVADGENVYVGSRDGYVYAARLDNGEPRWEFLAAPYDRRVINASQIESTWPVSALPPTGDRLTVTAGRTSAMSGGILEYVLDAATGEILSKKRALDQSGGQGGPVVESIPKGEEFDLWKGTTPHGSFVEEVLYRYRVLDSRGRTVSAGTTSRFSIDRIRANFAPGVVYIQLTPVDGRGQTKTVQAPRIPGRM